ncbi:phage head closure protein [Paracoccus laeviglucosivorans]|uniref:Phage head-tail adaptor, putative, SPP1 family n=1 Tax=Paracoccus laeviglucosivorans TaxID=1197861 RepID=A0A521E4M8_9RHOB|nr:phage head closure protein [Paracoccus laeviglucosivorans]SMO78898.1 phage head-tail adaptor, putative, SPP1 family [Paracoccus laeviglucosivorans]
MDIGEFSKMAVFRSPVKGRNPDGQIITSMEDRFSVWCKYAPMRGGESVMQARVTAKSPASVTVFRTRDTDLITSEWDVVINGKIHQLKEDPRESEDRAKLDMLVEAVG